MRDAGRRTRPRAVVVRGDDVPAAAAEAVDAPAAPAAAEPVDAPALRLRPPEPPPPEAGAARRRHRKAWRSCARRVAAVM